MVEPLRHRQTKGTVTDMSDLKKPRHISTLPIASLSSRPRHVRLSSGSGKIAAPQRTDVEGQIRTHAVQRDVSKSDRTLLGPRMNRR
jgi:hypothetical protein